MPSSGPTFRLSARRQFHWLLWIAACGPTTLLGTVAYAQNAESAPVEKLIDQPPFDEIVVREADGTKAIKVFPLDLPNRQVPSPFPGGKLQVRMLDRPAQPFDVFWSDITEVRLYENMLLAEAVKLTNQVKFNDAFDYYSRLIDSYPNTAGLNEAVERYLQQDALAAYKAGKYDRALAVLQSLYERNPRFGGLANAIDGVGSKIIDAQLAADKYSAARNTLELLSNQFPGLKLNSVIKYRQQFADEAAQKVSTAQKLADAKNFADARRAIQQALAIWPEAEQATQVLASIDTAYPMISVGVLEAVPKDLTPQIYCWPTLRCSRLTQRSLTELVDYGSEGGIYATPLGSMAQDAAGTTLTLQIERQRLDTDAIAAVTASTSRLLLGAADDPNVPYAAELIRRMSAVRTEFPDKLFLDFSSRHVRPEALLQLPLPSELERYLATNLFREIIREPGEVRFELANPREATLAGAVRSVEEVTFSNDDAAISAIYRGEVDILDRVPPWQVASLRSSSDVKIGTYRLPTVHVIIPNPSVPLVNSREFRRALAYGINRDLIVKEVLLGGQSLPGIQTISGPFPVGVSQSDPVRYAYNNQVKPRPYDPRLAALLATAAWQALNKPPAKPKSETSTAEGTPPEAIPEPPPLPPMPKLRLAHPADPVARATCQSIKQQIELIGIPIELIEVNSETADEGYELRYVELAVWEPLVDAARVLGINGIAGTTTDYMVGALRKLDSATTWNQVQAALYEIHGLAHTDLPVIPLWQTVNYFAYRRDFQGIQESPVVLYQNVSEWQRVVGTAQVR